MDRPSRRAQKTLMHALRNSVLAGLAAALLASPALAQGARGEARSEGDALLFQAGASDIFDNISADDGQDIKLKHKASGLVCVFNLGQPANRIVLFESGAKGDDFACATGGEAGQRTLYASRTPGRTLDQAFAHDVDEVKKNHPSAVAYALPPGTDSPILQMLDIPPMPPSKTARFIVDHTFSSVSSAMVKDWSLEFRFTC